MLQSSDFIKLPTSAARESYVRKDAITGFKIKHVKYNTDGSSIFYILVIADGTEYIASIIKAKLDIEVSKELDRIFKEVIGN